MATDKIINEVSKRSFYQRVGYIALKVAQNVASENPDTENHQSRAQYASLIFRGGDNAILLASHIVASNPTIASMIENGSGADVSDNDIEYAFSGIWTARSLAFFPAAVQETPVEETPVEE